MSNKKSFIREMGRYLLILTVLLVTILGFFLLSSYEILEKEIQDSANTFLKIYSNEFDNNKTKLDTMIKRFASQNENLYKIKSNNENERALAANALYTYLSDSMQDDAPADMMIVYDETHNICIEGVKRGILYNQKYELRKFTREALVSLEVTNFEWNFVTLNETPYLYKLILNEEQVIGIYQKADNLLSSLVVEENGSRSIVLANKDDVIGKVWGNENEEIFVGKNINQIDTEQYYKISKSIVNQQLKIYCFTSKTGIFEQTHSSMVVVASVVIVAVIFMFFILRYIKKSVVNPMKYIVEDMKKIKNGDYNNRIFESFHTKEFLILQETTNQMLDEIINLKIDSYEKRIELQDMELKSIRLQLKPHFFLNALTTISSLSSQSKNKQIRIYIDALSKNIRYMFRTGLHTVFIREEIKHVKNYFEMQELKYPDCIFYVIDLPKELEEWKIPQMIIHTFIENEYKYAVSVDTTLTVLIKIRKQYIKEEEMLVIEIEDDGKGYPKEVMEYVNGFGRKSNDAGTRIGLWSIKRMLKLMYEREDLLEIENAVPHGCLNRIWIPKIALHEIDEEIAQNKVWEI